MLIALENNTKTPSTWDFGQKIILLELLYAEYTENFGTCSMRFFRKIGKIAIFSIELTLNLTVWVENSKKSDFSVK